MAINRETHEYDFGHRNSRLAVNTLIVSVAIIIPMVMLSMMATPASSAPARGSNTIAVTGSGLDVVTPMDMRITGLSAESSSPAGQTSLVVTIAATNDIGSVGPNLARAVVTLKSLNLNVSYQYTSSLGIPERSTFVVTLTPSFAMLTDEHKTLSVVVAPLPVSAAGPVGVQISGRPIWLLESTHPDGSQETGYGKGFIPQFEGTVTAP